MTTAEKFILSEAKHLPNGAEILQYKHDHKNNRSVVLCKQEGKVQPYVTWVVDTDGNADWGRYFFADQYEEAIENFKIR